MFKALLNQTCALCTQWGSVARGWKGGDTVFSWKGGVSLCKRFWACSKCLATEWGLKNSCGKVYIIQTRGRKQLFTKKITNDLFSVLRTALEKNLNLYNLSGFLSESHLWVKFEAWKFFKRYIFKLLLNSNQHWPKGTELKHHAYQSLSKLDIRHSNLCHFVP